MVSDLDELDVITNKTLVQLVLSMLDRPTIQMESKVVAAFEIPTLNEIIEKMQAQGWTVQPGSLTTVTLNTAGDVHWSKKTDDDIAKKLWIQYLVVMERPKQ